MKKLQLVLYDNLPIVILPKKCIANFALDECEDNEYLIMYLCMEYRDGEGNKKCLFEGYCTVKVVDFGNNTHENFEAAALSDRELLDKLIVIKAEEPLPGKCEQTECALDPGPALSSAHQQTSQLPEHSIAFTRDSCSTTNITYKFNAVTKVVTKNVRKHEETSYVYDLKKAHSNIRDVANVIAQNDIENLEKQETDITNMMKNNIVSADHQQSSLCGPEKGQAPKINFSNVVSFPGQSGEVQDEVEIVDIE